MLKYAFISVVAVTYAEWKGKAFHKVPRYDGNLLYPMSYVYDPINTKTETKGEISL